METIERVLEILEALDGSGVIVTDEDLVTDTLKELGLKDSEDSTEEPPFRVTISDRMESNETIVWQGDNILEFIEQSRVWIKALEFMGEGQKNPKHKFKVKTYQAVQS